MPNWPQNSQKQHKRLFSGCFGPFLLYEWSNGFGWGLFSFLDIGPYIPPTCGPFGTSLGPFGGAPMAKKQHKNYFLVVLDHFF
jgi:hypothetical protein